MSGHTLKALYHDIKTVLTDQGIDTPDLDARLILRHVTGCRDADFISCPEQGVSGDDSLKVERFVERRLAGEPISKIIGVREFWGLDFKVTSDVLDPRPDTETIIDAVLKRFKDSPPETILDLGTGSGCLLVTLLHEYPQARGVGIDISDVALAVAQDNAAQNNVLNRATFLQDDWGESLTDSFDLIVSNPPYIPNPNIANLAIEVRNHDPILALDGGNDGLDSYRIIFSRLKVLLKSHGICFVEIGISQAEDVARLVEDSGLSVKDVHADIAGIPRVVEISFGEK